MNRTLEATLRVTIIYAVFAAVWILFSDMAVEAVSSEVQALTVLQTLKGWMFVAITALLLFVLIFRSHQRVERVFQLDGLTGLLNHHMFKQQLIRKLAERAEQQVLAVCYLEIDSFKQLNEKVGFDRADLFLKQLALDLETAYSADTIIGRLGPALYALSRNFNPGEDLEEKSMGLKQIFTQCAEHMRLDVTCSLGVATLPGDASGSNELMAAANEALRKAKANRDAIVFHDASLAEASAKRISLLRDFQDALQTRQLTLAYQPKYAIDGLVPTGVEVLLRWNHPYRGYISPAEFIPLAEQNGLSHRITQFVVETAAAELSATALLGAPLQHVAINVSAAEFNNPQEMDELLDMILRQPALAPYVRVEITETATLTDMRRSAAIIGKLRDSGLGFSVDDFGTGFTSLAMLKDFTIDEIKIDRSFVADLEHAGKSKTIVGAIIAMATSFNINIVAEGVETEAQLQILKDMGCKEAQGYLLGAPMDIQRLRQHLAGDGRIVQFLR